MIQSTLYTKHSTGFLTIQQKEKNFSKNMAWYNKYRPEDFEDVIGQELVKSVLQNALKKNRIKHAYLLNGPKGIGKTTLARIFANHLNLVKTNPEAKIDIIEMDAASNTGIDDIRQLIESAKTPPLKGDWKVYIIDEVHMLSKAAMNALLKILEEPPTYLVFLLATTDPEKLLPTVLSRLTKLNLTNHSISNLVKRLKYISEKENIRIDEKSLELIAKRSNGSQRDSINLLETISSYELDEYDIDNTSRLLGFLPEELLKNSADAMLDFENKTSEEIKSLLSELENRGLDGETFLSQLLEFLLDSSLNGDRQFDGLIVPLAEILDLKLPLTGIASSFALIQAKLSTGLTEKKSLVKRPENKNIGISEQSQREKVQNRETKTYKKVEKKPEQSQFIANIEEPKREDPSNSDDVEEADTISSKQEDFSTEQKVGEPETENKAQTKNNIDEKEISEFVKNLKNAPGSPPALKMIADLDGRIEDNRLILTVSAGIFESALKASNLQSWIKNQLKEKTALDLDIFVEVKTKKAKAQTNITNFDDNEQNKQESSNTIPKNSNQQAMEYKKSNVDGEIFYTVYKQLPENMENKGVGIRKESIPKPVKEEKNWDDHASELFDLE